MKKIISLLISAVLIALSIPMSLVAHAADGASNQKLVPDNIVIGFYPRTDFPGEEKQYDDEVTKVKKDGLDQIDGAIFLVKSEDFQKNPNATLNKYKNSRFIQFAEPNFIGEIEGSSGAANPSPTDPHYVSLNKPFAKNINAEEGWRIATKSQVTVAIVDTGYNDHLDAPVVNSYSVISKTAKTPDNADHGTLVAGTAGAIANNDRGSAGIIWGGNLMAVQITEGTTMTSFDSALGIRYAADNGARVINMSFSFAGDSVTLKDAVTYAYSKGCVLVAATGNESGAVRYPAKYPQVLAVGSTSNGTTRFSTSNYGDGLDVLASYSWVTTNNRGTYNGVSGTSIASPQVAGLAALIWELAPSLNNVQIIPVFVFEEDLLRSGFLQFACLALNVLHGLGGRASRISVNHSEFSPLSPCDLHVIMSAKISQEILEHFSGENEGISTRKGVQGES